jgi:hypothetical protein
LTSPGFASGSRGGGGLKFWGDASIDGRPRALTVDITGNVEGWEHDSARRVHSSFSRRDILVAAQEPLFGSTSDLAEMISGAGEFNAMLLLCRPVDSDAAAAIWSQLELVRSDALLAICTWDKTEPLLASAVAESTGKLGQLAAVQETPMSVRAAGLFFMKLFAELDLHSESTESMTGKMVWFGHSKAREILRRRHLDGRVSLKA